MRFFRKNTTNVDEENPYWMSFSDMMSALLVVFILASVVFIYELVNKQEQFDQEIKELQKAEQVRQTIIEEAYEALLAKGIKVEISQNDTVLSIPNELLGFDTGAYEIHKNFHEVALEIGGVLNRVVSIENRVDYLDTIFIEGHTDKRPFRGILGKGNWGLSAFRAISLWQFWDENLLEQYRLSLLTNKEGQPLFSVSGYAETRPIIKDQQTSEDFKKNRRIDIRFTIRRPNSAEYEAVLNYFKSNK